MAQHHAHDPADSHHADHDHADHADEAELAQLLELDAQVLGASLSQVIEWVAQHAPEATHRIVDVGAGTGTGSRALARRFPAAEVVAVDSSPLMLDRVRTSAREHGLADRVHVVEADLDAGWPDLGSVDVVWAALSLHHLADPDRLLRDVHAALNPDGLLAVVEMDTLPRFLPDDLGIGRAGLELRCHEALAQDDWNAHPDWRPQLEQAGFQLVEQRRFPMSSTADRATTGRYAQAYLRRVRGALDERLAADDLATLDQLLADDHPAGLLRRGDLTVRGSRTGWAARRR